MELKLNVYGKDNKISKTYTASEFDLMWGTIEDLVNCIDIDKVDDNVAVGKMILHVLPQLKPLLKQIFPDLTDSELRCTKVKELVPIFVKSFQYAFQEIGLLDDKSGN